MEPKAKLWKWESWNFKVETAISRIESANLKLRKLRSSDWNCKLWKLRSSNLKLELRSTKVRNFETWNLKLQSWDLQICNLRVFKLKLQTAISDLSLQTGIRRSKVHVDLRLSLHSSICKLECRESSKIASSFFVLQTWMLRSSKIESSYWYTAIQGIRRSKIASSYYDLQTVKAESLQRLSLHGIRRSKVYGDLRLSLQTGIRRSKVYGDLRLRLHTWMHCIVTNYKKIKQYYAGLVIW